MAFKVRCEYWNVSNDGVGATILDTTFADATEYFEDAADVTLPATKGSYAMRVICLEGAATIEVSSELTGQAARGGLVTNGNSQYFLVKSNNKMTVKEYTIA